MSHYQFEPANFTDYRDFLNHRFETLKAANKRLSLQSCASKSKVSKSLLQFLFRKKRHISLDTFPGLAKTLKLSDEEEYFVYLMICKNSSRNPTVQAHFETILSRVRHQYVTTDQPEPERNPAFSKPLYENHLFMVLQTMVRLKGFREDPEWILKQLVIKDLTVEKIKSTLLELETLGYLSRNDEGALEAKPQTLWRPDPYDPTGQRVFTRGAEAIAELMQHPNIYKPSVYMSMSLAMDEEHLLATEKYMIEVHHQLSKFAAESKTPTASVFCGNYFLTLARLKDA